MTKHIEKEEIKQFKGMRKPLSLQDAMKESERCLLCKDAPCSEGCPAKTDPGKFIRQIRFENFKGAARTIRNNNPLGSVCAAVCPYEQLCVKNCSVCALEKPIDIGGLQRFAVEYGDQTGIEPVTKGKQDKAKVAVIGAGPAGIGCATELTKMGYQVTIFEKTATIGGIANWGIPEYRLAPELLAIDMKNLTDLGVKIEFNKEINSKAEVDALLGNEYKAAFIGAGFSEPYRLPMLQGLSNVTTFSDFLATVKTDKNSFAIKDKVVAVIGGGSVAMDVATTAAALGAKKVYAVFLESLAECPAGEEELEIAREMDIILKPSSQIVEAIKTGESATGLKGIEIEWQEPNNFSPNNAKPIAGTEFNLKVNFVVEAIGAKPNPLLAELKTDGRLPNSIFAGGDITNGGASVVQAVADGKAAALSINDYITKGAN